MDSETLCQKIIESLDDAKAQDVTVLDVRELTDFTDFMIVASGSSDRHTRAVADRVRNDLSGHGEKPYGSEGEDAAEWVLLDYGDVVLHVMRASAREFYDLENLWSSELKDSIVEQRDLSADR